MLTDHGGRDRGFDLVILEDSINAGGSLRFLLEFLDHTRSRGLKSCYLAYRGGGLWADKFVAAADGSILCDGSPRSLQRALDDLGDLGATRMAVNHISPLRALAEVPRRRNLHVVAHIHGENDARDLAAGHDLISVPDRLVFHSEWNHRQFLDAADSGRIDRALPVSILPNQVPRHVVDGARRPRTGSGKTPIITVLSRIDARKFDNNFLVAVAKALRSTHPSHVIEVAGFGSRFRDLNESAERMGVAQTIRCVGLVDDVKRFLEQGPVSFLPSYSESCPYSWLEAAWLGRRTVVPDSGIFTELTSNRMLHKFAPHDVDSAVDALHRAIDAADEPPLRSWPPQRFVDWDGWRRTLDEIYDL